MLKNISYIIGLLFCFTACQTNTSNIEDSISEEIAALADKKTQRAFLEKIAASDQTVRAIKNMDITAKSTNKLYKHK